MLDTKKILKSLGCVSFERSCVVPDDDSEVIRHATPTTEQAKAQIREQNISKMVFDVKAVLERESRIAIQKRTALKFKKRA